MNTNQVLTSAASYLEQLIGHEFDVLSISPPQSNQAADHLSRIVSKLSPFLGNLIEFSVVEHLNAKSEFTEYGQWERQDPGFPDTVFRGSVFPVPGIEIKAWFPLATEITARFKDSQLHFNDNQTKVCLLAWLPDHVIYGKPVVVDVVVVDGASLAQARDSHYHRPPTYLVLEPEDTSARTSNLQQSNTNGYRWQGSPAQLEQARQFVEGWGPQGLRYQTSRDYQALLRELQARYPYRLDTNFAKIDRVGHPGLEAFKRRVLAKRAGDATVADWVRIVASSQTTELLKLLGNPIQVP